MKHIPFAVGVSLLTLLSFTVGCGTQSSATGRDGSRLSLSEPSDQTMTQGEANRVQVSVARAGFADAVQITFSNLPRGVRVDGDNIPAGDSTRSFVLTAAPDATTVNKHIVTVQAKGAGITTSQTFELTIHPRS